MIEGMAETIGMVAGLAGAIIVAHRAEIEAILARYKRKAATHRRAVTAKPEYQGRHRFDDTQPWESRVFDEDKKEAGRVRFEATPTRRAGGPDQRRSFHPLGDHAGAARAGGQAVRDQRPARVPAGPARQRFARASERSERLMALR